MITRSSFVKIMYALQEQEERDRIISSRLNSVMDESTPSVYFTQCVSPILSALKAELKDEGEWIDWWVYEKDFGRKKGLAAWEYDEITEIQLNSSHQLYDFLVKNYEESKEK